MYRPRARGGVPAAETTATAKAASSPRTRGCTAGGGRARRARIIVPAHAGVYRPRRAATSRCWYRPRARGGVPIAAQYERTTVLSSPRTRGCTAEWLAREGVSRIVPAHAGVYRARRPGVRGRPNRPRARGGVPLFAPGAMKHLPSSPRTRGCTVRGLRQGADPRIVPAHAGVYRPARSEFLGGVHRPRARGGVPTIRLPPRSEFKSSPRTRGCTAERARLRASVPIVPAHAGVYRRRDSCPGRQGHRPRARGGVPAAMIAMPRPIQSSPRTRGCTVDQPLAGIFGFIVPAHAGVYRSGSRGSPCARSSSPRTRGCTVPMMTSAACRSIVPAHAGVYRPRRIP